MTSRARYEHQIKMLDTWAGNELDDAVHRVIARYRGLSFFTDEQIEEIRAEMIQREWFSHKLKRENRKRRAA
jgi:hypothetical protein